MGGFGFAVGGGFDARRGFISDRRIRFERRFAADSPVEESVTCEQVSSAKFPANREKYREFLRFRMVWGI